MAEFNTYDILKQRYLILTREALVALKEQVKDNRRAIAPTTPEPRGTAKSGRRANHGHIASSAPSRGTRARFLSRIRS